MDHTAPAVESTSGKDSKPTEEIEKEEDDHPPATCMKHLKDLPSTFLKQADQNSPLVLIKMPKVIAFTIALTLLVAYLLGFIYQLAEMYGRCEQDNNCISCAITNSETEGATCNRLAETQLNIRSGCMTIGLPNEYDIIADILKNTDTLIKEAESEFSPAMFESLTRHGEIVETLQKNNLNQLIDPDVNKLRSFFKKNFMGMSNALSDPASIDALDDSVIIGSGLKVLYSYISIGCALHSKDGGIQALPGFPGGDNNPYTSILVCGCELYCPTDIAVVAGSLDASIPNLDNGLNSASLALPDQYVQTADPTASPAYNRRVAALEFQYYVASGGPNHCANSVFTGTPSSLNSVLYECCTEKTNLEKLSETSAFAGLVLTFAIVATTILFYPWSPKQTEDGEEVDIKGELQEKILSAFG